jgi:hypothetical protein
MAEEQSPEGRADILFSRLAEKFGPQLFGEEWQDVKPLADLIANKLKPQEAKPKRGRKRKQ